MAVADTTNPAPSMQRGIGSLGTAARVAVGILLLSTVAWGHVRGDFHPAQWALGLLGFPAVVLAGQWLRARRTPTRLRATGPAAHVLNLLVPVALYLTEATSDATLVFYSASMLLAAVRGYAGCEVLAVPNWLLGRDDQIGCAVFLPIDHLERRQAPPPAGPARP
jgi:hypothetical protein